MSSTPDRTRARRARRRVVRCCLSIALASGATLAVAAGCSSESKKPTAVLKPRYPTLPPKVVPEFLKGTILERVDVHGAVPLNVNNFGLVANLPGRTGDAVNVKGSIKEYILKEMTKAGIGSTRTPGLERLTAEEMLKDPRTAIVRVDGLIPPGARRGQRFDVAVSVLNGNNTSSLAGGTLYRTDLKLNGANPDYPGRVIDNEANCEGGLFVNPAYAFADSSDPTAKASLRFATILGGGTVLRDRPITLRIRQPQLSMSRAIEYRVNEFFHEPAGNNAAAAFDEGQVRLVTPMRYRGDWEHYVGVVSHLYFNVSDEFATRKARELAEEAVKPDAPLMDISYCWEGLGNHALAVITPLMGHRSPEVAFSAARAAAFIGDSSAISVLGQMARTENHPFQLAAVQVLGALPQWPPSPAVAQVLRTLLDSPQNTVRIEAYQILAEAGDNSIYSKTIANKFMLDIVPTPTGTPMIYCTRRGIPRLAIFGPKPALDLPVTFSAMPENRLTISSQEGDRVVSIFYRDPALTRWAKVPSHADIAEIVARLGGEGSSQDPQRFNFSYSDVVAVLQKMMQQQSVVALTNGGQRTPTAFVLQELPRMKNEIDSAPTIPEGTEQGRPQGDLSENATPTIPAAAADPAPAAGTHVEARK